MRRVCQDGRPRLVAVGRVVETNDIGQYRLFGLAAGTYYLGASGTVWAVGAGTQAESSTSVPTYYPGTMTIADAQRVTVGTGEDRGGIDITLLPIRAVRVSGVALDSSGKPAESLRLLPTDPVGGIAATGSIGPATPLKADGSFAIGNVAPGEYLLVATARHGETGESELAAQRLSVAGDDVSGLTLVTAGGGRVSGRVVRDTGGALPFATPALRVWSEPVGDAIAGSAGGSGRVAADWTFEIKGVAGRRLLRVSCGCEPRRRP
jgi:hypothetical protein